MPYFAYCLGGDTVNIIPLFERNLILTHKLELDPGEEIQKLIFSYNKNLYAITRKLCPIHGQLTNFSAY